MILWKKKKKSNSSDVVLSLFVGKRCKNLWTFIAIMLPNFLAAFLEGGSFLAILLAFAQFTPNGEAVLKDQSEFLVPLMQGITFSSSFVGLVCWILVAIGLQALRSSILFLASYLMSNLSLKIQEETQHRIYSQIFRLSFPYVNRYQIGDLAEYAKTPSAFITPMMHSINGMISSSLLSLVSLGLMFQISFKLTGITLAVFTIVYASQKLIIQLIINKSKDLAELMASFGKVVIQNLEGLRLIHTYHRHAEVLSGATSLIRSISEASKKLYLCHYAIPAITEIAGVISVAVILLSSLFLFRGGDMLDSASYLFTFLVLAYRTANRIQQPIANYSAAAMHAGSLLRLREILKDEGKEYLPIGGKPFHDIEEKIELSQVSLQYQETSSPAVDHISFSIPKGKVTAIVGPSGGGKSSILDLLIRLYTPTSGHILVDGQDLLQYDLASWRSLLGVVGQNPFIFDDTVEENIRFGLAHATTEEITHAAHLAQADEFILKLSDGYKTRLGEKGYKLSGGQLQRISLARALLKKPKLLILDEATSNLDSLTEFAVHGALEEFFQDRTTLIVAHRLSTIQHADQILYLEKGKLIERGSHEELLALNGKYAKLWEFQSLRKDFVLSS